MKAAEYRWFSRAKGWIWYVSAAFFTQDREGGVKAQPEVKVWHSNQCRRGWCVYWCQPSSLRRAAGTLTCSIRPHPLKDVISAGIGFPSLTWKENASGLFQREWNVDVSLTLVEIKAAIVWLTPSHTLSAWTAHEMDGFPPTAAKLLFPVRTDFVCRMETSYLLYYSFLSQHLETHLHCNAWKCFLTVAPDLIA